MDGEGYGERDAVPGPGEEWIWAISRAAEPSVGETGALSEPAFARDDRSDRSAAADGSATRLRETTGHAARVALGLTVLAAERLGSPTDRTLAIGVGLAQQTAHGLRGVAGRFAGPIRAASRRIDWATKRSSVRANASPLTDASPLSNARRLSNAGPVVRGRAEFNRLVERARERGQATMDAGRTEASEFLRASVNDGISWAEDQAVPQVVDGMVPHLVESVVPQIIEGVLPEIRAKVLPVIIDDLTNDPRLRELVLEQSRDVVGEAAQHLRSATATADDRVESAFRRLVHGASAEAGAAGPASRTEPLTRTEPSRTEPSRTEPSRTEPSSREG